MTDKERLNTILRLRLFFSTEKELGEMVGLSLKGNHFSRQKPFTCEAFFSKFSEECKLYTKGEVELSWLICQYETTSRYFKQNIENTAHESNKRFIQYLLNYIYMGEIPSDDANHLKYIMLCKRYDTYNMEYKMNIGILILMTYGIIPTFKNKSSQDVSNIIEDFNKAYTILLNIAQDHQFGASTQYKEIPCLKEMRRLIEEEQKGENNLNRLLLIHITNDILNIVFALKKPEKLRQYSKEVVPMDFNIVRLWRCEEEADNIIWELVPLNLGTYYLYRNEIDYKRKKIRFTKYQLTFTNIGYKDFCSTIIVCPQFNWHNMLKREVPDDSILIDYTEIEYEEDKYTVKQLTFTQESPNREMPITLKAIKKRDSIDYYIQYLNHEGMACDYEDEDIEGQYAIAIETLEVAVTNTAILFKGDNVIYKLDKFDKEGNETISGISSLNNTDNYIYAELEENGIERHFICLDSINQNLDLNELLDKPFFYEIKNIEEIF